MRHGVSRTLATSSKFQCVLCVLVMFPDAKPPPAASTNTIQQTPLRPYRSVTNVVSIIHLSSPPPPPTTTTYTATNCCQRCGRCLTLSQFIPIFVYRLLVLSGTTP